MNDRLYRTVDDRVIAGVCGGLARRLQVDPSLVRVGYVIVAFLTGFLPLIVLYVIMAVVIPEEPTGFAGRPAAPGPDAVPGWAPPAGQGTWPPPTTTAPAWPPPPASTPPQGEASAWPPIAAAPGEGGTGTAPDAGPPPAAGTPPAWSQPAPSWDQPAQRDRPRNDALLGIVGGIVLVGLGIYFLVRDRITIDWSIVGAAALVGLGVLIIVAAFVRPRR